MAYNQIIVTEKYEGAPSSFVTGSRRIATPTIIQPDYQFDVSDMYGIFIPCASIGDGLVWDTNTRLLDVDTAMFMQNASFGWGFEWNTLTKKLDVDTSINIYVYEADASLALANLQDKDILQYDINVSAFTNEQPIEITNYFYTKQEINNFLDQVDGGYY